jgi:hypothetical protein
MTRLASRSRAWAASSSLAVAALSGAFVCALPADVAEAQPHGPATLVVNAEVMVLLATEVVGRGSIDPSIGNLPQLRKPPLSAFNSYHLLDKRMVALPMGRSGAYTMPNGQVLQLTFVEPSAERAMRLKVAINQPGGAPYAKLQLSPRMNEWFFVAGPPWNGGTIILAVSLRP